MLINEVHDLTKEKEELIEEKTELIIKVEDLQEHKQICINNH